MEFISGLLWGTGLSLGMCVGLVAWAFLRTATNWLLGITETWDTATELNRKSLEALRERNRLTDKTNELLKRYAIELMKHLAVPDSE